jgi:hypothetical protein
VRISAAGLVLAACCSVAFAAPVAQSADGRWRVQGQGNDVVVLDAGQPVKTLPARSLAGGAPSTISTVRYLPQRRSFVIAFETLPELWELSVDPNAPPIFDGLVHDYRMGEAIASPGFLGVRRTALEAPALSIDTADARGAAYVVVRTGKTRWLVNLDVRRAIERLPQGDR